MPAKSSPSGAPPRIRFSTDAFSERERLTAWREIVGRSLVNVDIEPLEREGYRADATVVALPGLSMLFVYSEAHRCDHTRALIKNDDLSFMAAPQCRWAASQIGRNTALEANDGVLMSNADVGSVTLASGTHFAAFSVPRAAIAPLVPDLGDAIAQRIPSGNPAFQLLLKYLASVRDTHGLLTPELQQLAVTHMYDLIAVVLGATRDAGAAANGRGVRTARLVAAKAYVRQHLHRPDLRADAVAAHLGVTPRYVHKLFETEGRSFLEYVFAERLTRAYHALASDSARSISAIAFAAGFNDLSHFNRTFRRCFGRTPSDVRGEAWRLSDSK
jgi:AraC-like DNA-binding protein